MSQFNNCPTCNAALQDTEEKKHSIRPLTGGTITRILGTRYQFACGAVVLQNENYPTGTIEIPCGGIR